MKQKLPEEDSGKSASSSRIIAERPFNTTINVALSSNDKSRDQAISRRGNLLSDQGVTKWEVQ